MVRLAVNLQKAIRLVFTNRSGLPDRHYVSDMRFTDLVVGLEPPRLLDSLLIQRVRDDVFYRDYDGFLHLVADDPTRLCLDLTRHLDLLFPFSQERQNPGYLSLCVSQPSSVLGLSGGETKANSQ
jgi:hypothetical protein